MNKKHTWNYAYAYWFFIIYIYFARCLFVLYSAVQRTYAYLLLQTLLNATQNTKRGSEFLACVISGRFMYNHTCNWQFSLKAPTVHIFHFTHQILLDLYKYKALFRNNVSSLSRDFAKFTRTLYCKCANMNTMKYKYK